MTSSERRVLVLASLSALVAAKRYRLGMVTRTIKRRGNLLAFTGDELAAELRERGYFVEQLPDELLATLGAEGFERGKDAVRPRLDPDGSVTFASSEDLAAWCEERNRARATGAWEDRTARGGMTVDTPERADTSSKCCG